MSYVLREAEMPILPAGHANIRILHFSDLHLTPARKSQIADIKSFASRLPLGHVREVAVGLLAQRAGDQRYYV